MAKPLRVGTVLALAIFAFLWGSFATVAQEKAPEKKAEVKDPVKEVDAKVDKVDAKADKIDARAGDAQIRGDVAWMLISSALVMLMVPGLALFYGGMVRRKNVLATMMHSMICLSIVGVFWIGIGYSLAFGDPWLTMPNGASLLGWSSELVFLRGVRPDTMVPNLNIPVYLHMVYQGMFAIITPALISGALAERIRFRSYLAFIMIWMVVVYCPLAQCVWAMNWNWGHNLMDVPKTTALELVAADEKAKQTTVDEKKAKLEKSATDETAKQKIADDYEKDKQKITDDCEKDRQKITKDYSDKKDKYVEAKVAAGSSMEAKKEIEEYYAKPGTKMSGWLGKMDALDFAGGTVVHIAAGLSSLACFLVLRRRRGYPEYAFHPNSMVLTLTGAGILWFGWFGFNGGSALGSGSLATSAFVATQAAAAAAGLSWAFFEWFHRGKPTALGFASGVVAGLVAVTPAAGYVVPWAGLVIGLLAGVLCYGAVYMKGILKYDDSLDAFGVHGVGGFFGAVITGFFCWKPVNAVAIVNDGFFYASEDKFKQVGIQLLAATAAAVLAFVGSVIIAKVVDLAMGFTVSDEEETTGLDRVEHGEAGFDLGLALEAVSLPVTMSPRSASLPPNGVEHFHIDVEGVSSTALVKVWGELCQPSKEIPAAFKAIYPHMTTVKGNRFSFRGGDPTIMKQMLEQLLKDRLKIAVKASVVK